MVFFTMAGRDSQRRAALCTGSGLTDPSDTRQWLSGWTTTYQWENLYGLDYLYAGPLFIHQFSHAWIDFRRIRDVSCAKRKVITSKTAARRPTFSANMRCATRTVFAATAEFLGPVSGRRTRAANRQNRRPDTPFFWLHRARRAVRSRRWHDRSIGDPGLDRFCTGDGDGCYSPFP